MQKQINFKIQQQIFILNINNKILSLMLIRIAE